jgi:hypothetical protein
MTDQSKAWASMAQPPTETVKSMKKVHSPQKMNQTMISARTVTPQFIPAQAEGVLIQEGYKRERYESKIQTPKKLTNASFSSRNLINHDIEASVEENRLKN